MIREAKIEDLKEIMNVIDDARNQLKESGSLQWNLDDGYPAATDLINDIVCNKVFVYTAGRIEGCIVMCAKDEFYETIDLWDNTIEYVALHRLAVLKDAQGKGIAAKLLQHCIKEADGKVVRGDTHPTNAPMTATFIKTGFKKVGDITLTYLPTFNERVIYEYKKEL